MRTYFLTLSLLISLTLFSQQGCTQEKSIIAQGAEIEQAGTGYFFTEGPAEAADGKVYFTDQPSDRIYVWDENEGISLWLDGTLRSNGMFFDKEGRLFTCADLYNQLGYFDSEKTFHLVYEKYDDKLLNGPNDVWVTPDGGIYFTDSYYHRTWWDEGRCEEQDVRGVYYLSPDGEVVRVVDDYIQPNGLVGTPDGKVLYVADIDDRKIWKYDIEADGLLSNKTFFAPHGSDGMTIDKKGNVYLTMGKVWVYSPAGELIEAIDFPESPSNICFGGKDKNILFVTARTSVYTLKTNMQGVN